MSTLDLNTFQELKDATGADYIAELIDAFLDDAPNLFTQMNSARMTGDAETFRRAAHSLKSNAATFGAMELSALAKELEGMARENNLEIGTRLEVMQDAYRRVESQLRALK
ncbi:MAG: Hpt domain-containing protein [Chloroflexi bacterium]|nr:Hpt domain-containing protein [Chloroflexota bacterium]